MTNIRRCVTVWATLPGKAFAGATWSVMYDYNAECLCCKAEAAAESPTHRPGV